MAKPAWKDPSLDRWIFCKFGIDRTKSIENDICVECGRPAAKFRDTLSRHEYTISGLCQGCQDSIFGGRDSGEIA